MELAIGWFKINWWVMRVIQFFSRSKGIDHCSLIFRVKGDSARVVHIQKKKSAKIVRLSVMLKVYTPIETFSLGDVDMTEAEIRDYFAGDYRFQLWRTVLWFFVTRWFSDWVPSGGCGVVSSKILRDCGFNVNSCVKPIDLYKELEDGNYIISRTSWGG